MSEQTIQVKKIKKQLSGKLKLFLDYYAISNNRKLAKLKAQYQHEKQVKKLLLQPLAILYLQLRRKLLIELYRYTTLFVIKLLKLALNQAKLCNDYLAQKDIILALNKINGSDPMSIYNVDAAGINIEIKKL